MLSGFAPFHPLHVFFLVHVFDTGYWFSLWFFLGPLSKTNSLEGHRASKGPTKPPREASRKRDLLVIIGVLTFLLSSVLNNLTVVIVMVSLLQKLVKAGQSRRTQPDVCVSVCVCVCVSFGVGNYPVFAVLKGTSQEASHHLGGGGRNNRTHVQMFVKDGMNSSPRDV